MTDSSHFTYPSPLEGYEDQPAISGEMRKEGNAYCYVNEQTGVLSRAYETFTNPITNGPRGGFDVHIYHFQGNVEQSTYARALWERIRREFPELRIYRFFDKPIGPHPVAMFEVNLFTPAQFGAFISWLVIHRGPLSVLIHPNTEEEERDHTQRATWMGDRLPLDLSVFKRLRELKVAMEAKTSQE
ncbi:hypothetical protein MMC17_009795 [Xylographa soralifera]|nr:hypothetical protein [Xylographa soralifera]